MTPFNNSHSSLSSLLSLLLFILLWCYDGNIHSTISSLTLSSFANAFSINHYTRRRRRQIQNQKHFPVISSALLQSDIEFGTQQISKEEEETIIKTKTAKKKQVESTLVVASDNSSSVFEQDVMSFFQKDCNLTCTLLNHDNTSPRPFRNFSTIKHGNIYQLSHHPNKPNVTLPFIHVIPTPTSLDSIIHPQASYLLTSHQQQQSTSTSPPPIIHLHQDLWYAHPTIITSRLKTKCGIAQKIQRMYARQTTSKRITSKEAQDFLEQYHLWSSTKAKFNYGLFVKSKNEEKQEEELVAVATYSPRRHVTRHSYPKYRSHELIRYCTKPNISIIGGLTKLLSIFIKEHAPDDIVTCIDRDWGSGVENWVKLGFEIVEVMPPVPMIVHRENKEKEEGMRKYLVGANLDQDNDYNGTNNDTTQNKRNRMGIGKKALSSLELCNTPTQVKQLLYKDYSMVPVYDAGVERLALLVSGSKLEKHGLNKRKELGLPPPPIVPFIPIPHQEELKEKLKSCVGEDEETESLNKEDNAQKLQQRRPMTVKEIWDASIPKYVAQYYSKNKGVTLLLEEAATGLLLHDE